MTFRPPLARVCVLLFALSIPATAQESNLERLKEPAIAAALKLTDAQKTQVTQILTARDEAVKNAGDAAAKQAAQKDANTKLAALLQPRQNQLFQSLFSGTRIRFNFKAQKWADVLDYIATEADLALVMNEAPAGVFNYSDSKEYTPSEAIDLVNGWLLTKGHTLVRRERMLMCLSLKNGLPDNAVPRIKPEELATRGRFEMVSVLIPLEGRPIDSVTKELEAIKGTYGKITPLTSTGQVLVTDTAGTVKAMQPIIKAIKIPPPPAKPKPKPPAKPKPKPAKPPAPVIQVHPIKHANPEQVGEVLKKFVSGTILVDKDANQITISAIPTAQETAKSIIKRLEENQGPDKQPKLKLYPIRIRDTEELTKTIELAAPAAKTRIEDDGRTLVAWATPKEHKQVENVLEQLSAKGETAASTQLETYRVEKVSPSAASALLQELLPDARMTANDDSDTLIVVGSLADHRAVRALIDQIEKNKTTQRSLKTFDIEGVATTSISTLVETYAPSASVTFDEASKSAMVVAKASEHELLQKAIGDLKAASTKSKTELKTYPSEDIDIASVTSLLATLTPGATITEDAPNRRLVVVASATDHEKIDNVLKQVKQTPAAQKTLKPYPLLKGQSTESVTEMLATLVPDATVTVDATNKRFLVVADEKNHAVLAKTLEQLGLNDPSEPELKFYPKERDVDSTTTTELIAELVPDAKVRIDEANSRYVVTATTDDHDKIQNILQQAGIVMGKQRALQAYELPEGQTMETVSALLSSLAPNATVTPDATNRQLLIVADTRDHETIAATLAQLGRGDQLPELRFYPIAKEVAGATTVLGSVAPTAQITSSEDGRRLSVVAKAADHARIKSTLEKLVLAAATDEKPSMKIFEVTPEQRKRFTAIADGLTEQLPGLQVITSTDPRELTIWARPKQQDVVSGILEQLKRDVPPEQKPSLIVYPITKVDVASVQPVLSELFPAANINVDEKTSRLLIKALPAEHKAIDAAIKQLDSDAPVSTKIKIMAYPVDGLTSTTVVSAIQAELPDVTVIEDTTAQSVIIRGRMRDHERVAEIIAALRETAGTLRKRRVVVYPAVFGSSTRTVQFITTAFEGTEAVVDATSGRLTVWATDKQHEEIEKAVAAMSGADGGELAPVTETYDIRGIESVTLLSMLTKVVPDARVVTNAQGTRLVAFARKTDHNKIRSIISGSLANAGKDRELQIFDVKPENIATAKSVVAEAMPEVSFVDSENNNALLGWVDGDQAATIKQLIEQLEGSKSLSTERELKVFDIKEIGAEAARPVLTDAFPTVTFRDSPDGNSLIARVKADEATKIEATLKQLADTGAMKADRTLQVYDIEKAGGDEARTAIAARVPTVTFSGSGNRMIAWVLPTEHEKIEGLIGQLTKEQPFKTDRALKAYSIRGLGPNAQPVLQAAAPAATILGGSEPDQLLIRARTAEHEKINKTLQQMQMVADAAPKRSLATFDIEGLDASAIQATISPLMDGDVQVTVDPTGRRLFVRAFPEKQKQITELVESVIKTLPSRKDVETKLYRTLVGDADEVQEAIKALYPDAILVTDAERKVLVATALPKEHVEIAKVVDEMTSNGAADQLTARTYPIRKADGAGIQFTLVNLYRRGNVRVSYDEKSHTLLAVASEKDHKAIKQLIEQVESEASTVPERELATFDIEGLDAKAVRLTIEPLVGDDAQVTVDPTGRRLFVRATPEKQKRIGELVNSVIESLPSREGVTTKAYRTLLGDARAVSDAIKELHPDAVVVTDVKRQLVVATALPTEHEAIAEVVKEMVGDTASTRPVARTYPIRTADGVVLEKTLRTLYLRTDVKVSFDSGSKTLLAVATEDEHTAIKSLIDQVEKTDAPEDKRTVEFYSLEGADGDAVQSVVKDLLDVVDPKASVVPDDGSGQLVVTTIASGHDKVKDAIDRLQSNAETREFEVFQLDRLEAFNASLAVSSMFGDTNFRDQPVVQSDDEQQQLLVRGTTQQIDQIRDLLVKMGEVGLRKGKANSKLRVIPVNGDAAEAIRSIEKVWPKLRKNPIRILRPDQRGRAIVPGKPFPVPSPKSKAKLESDEPLDDCGWQEPEQTDDEEPESDQEASPILVVPGDGRITISSDDTEALDQMEAVLRAVFSRSGGRRARSSKDFSVYALTNAAASQVGDLLNNIFGRENSPIAFGNVVIVPDQRLNALIVFAGRTDREKIEELIEILDSDNIPETVATQRTKVVEVKYADAEKIQTVISGIYRAQMSAGGTRSQISIPKGVPAQVATVLRQINAASSAPLLTVQVESTTNSLIVLAPQNLLDEVTDLIKELDQAAATSRARGVSIIELRKTNSRRVMDVLDRVLKK